PQPVKEQKEALRFVDWDKTRAYAVGINSIYLNTKGREKRGIVTQGERRALLNSIAHKLEEIKDEEAGNAQAVVKAYIVEDEYPSTDVDNAKVAPDILVGYARNYRGSWSTTTGGYRNNVIENNTERWSGDHCIAAFLVPGVFLSNRR